MIDAAVLVAFPCGHTRLVSPDDPLDFEPQGVRVKDGVYYCHECYQEEPRRFTWLEPGQMFVYIDESTRRISCKIKMEQ